MDELTRKTFDALSQKNLLRRTHINNLLYCCYDIMKKDPRDWGYIEPVLTARKEENRRIVLHELEKARNHNRNVATQDGYDAGYGYWEILLFEARNRRVDSYFEYLERYRDPADKFYQPRKQLLKKHGIIQGLQDLVDDKIDILSMSLPPGIGKTTCGEYFLSGFMGWFPELCNLFSSHSGHVTNMVYGVITNIIGTDLKQGQTAEYAWREISLM